MHRPSSKITNARQATDKLNSRSSGKTSEGSIRHPIGALFVIGSIALTALIFAWCAVYGVWNIDSNGIGETPALVLGVRMFAIAAMGMAAVLMGALTCIAVPRWRGVALVCLRVHTARLKLRPNG
ncbi:hypothetical protein K227x_61920 [Rubripirellula lacrimiformis]|uniref:Uncharacterized protein n=1 Tax=Rubripirellula lacrimiformis TaxID=1930273 RepID=A0A517NKU6_9BACT|nr:hypothetical protein K227x_61920 [Rubripirellula lacrimiformis]